MFEMLKNWYSRRLSDPQAMGLLAILLFGFIAIYFFSDFNCPVADCHCISIFIGNAN